MITEMKRVRHDNSPDAAEKVVVAVKASKEVPKTALVWALTHVVHPGDCIVLIVVVPSQTSGRRMWGFPRFAGDCANGNRKCSAGTSSEQRSDITDSCSQMILRLHDVYDPRKINVKVKIVAGSPCGSVAAEAKRVRASWVVLDKQLKHEEKRCTEELQCNIVVMKHSQPKILRLNLIGSTENCHEADDSLPSALESFDTSPKKSGMSDSIRGPVVTPTSSPELGTSFTPTEPATSPVSSSDPGASPFFTSENTINLKKGGFYPYSDSERFSAASGSFRFQPWMTDFSGSVREAVSLSRNAPSGPPPLCSMCQHKAPVFGKPPRWFSYSEIEQATGGFSRANFLAEGGYGSVHRGVLPDGQAVAVKQHKLASSQGDHEFCSEVEVLSCAQHRNVVMLIGFCIEDERRLLVYEFICNGSLDSHLYARGREALEWPARQKIAVGAARGLRYLHEECRVGCIVHRDMRPNNILITHDFEPLVGDFGLARWQPDGDAGVETRVIGTFGYLAPEYAETGQITEKADVYSFGVVLVELLTGRKAVDLNRPKGQQCLAEWARPLLEEYAIDALIDPRLTHHYSEQEVCFMVHAASLCIRRDPQSRPRMSQVLRILEGDIVADVSPPGNDVGSRSARIRADRRQQRAMLH